MKSFLRYFAHHMKYTVIVVAVMIISFIITALVCFWNDADGLRVIMIYSLVCSGFAVLVTAAMALGKCINDAADYPFDTRVIGKTFNTILRDSRLFHKGVSALHKNDFNTALEIFSGLQDFKLKDSWKAVLCYFHGRTYHLMGYPTNAAKYYTQSIELGINIDDIYIMVGRCYTNTGCYNEAVEYYEALLNKDTYMDYVITDMGMAYLKGNMPEKAFDMFNKSVSKGMNYAFALGGCSLACLQMNDVDKSREYFGRALINNMDDIDGFKRYYCKIAEANGILDKIDNNMRINDKADDDEYDE